MDLKRIIRNELLNESNVKNSNLIKIMDGYVYSITFYSLIGGDETDDGENPDGYGTTDPHMYNSKDLTSKSYNRLKNFIQKVLSQIDLYENEEDNYYNLIGRDIEWAHAGRVPDKEIDYDVVEAVDSMDGSYKRGFIAELNKKTNKIELY